VEVLVEAQHNNDMHPTKLSGKTLAKFEAERDVWQEVLDGVREIKAGGGKRTKVEAKSSRLSIFED